ncbi:MAG: bifunctional alpha,alpha-trehalose-phosphate synthase (UDP-forming)/trehalose-phosphatase [Chitinophagaceae bacterium]|nr:bifunctional alpha,alpha-trehalose-phosphate synthase (UDP-forming)/trehalose-phosphatase [Chitinophagaceae bacterium]
MSRLIIVSNRLPFSVEKSGGDFILRQSSGGLVSALKSYLEKTSGEGKKFREHIWIGSVDFSPQIWKKVKDKTIKTSNFRVEPIYIEPDVYDSYYNGFSNSTLWPLFHYFPFLAEYDKEYYESYIQVNFLFAEKILSFAKKDDIIWVHDYQLMLVPQILRKKRPDLTIGFFLHIPFPSYEIFRLLPTSWKASVLQGMLGADLIGFHTHDYVQHFIQSAKMILRVDSQFNTIQYGKRLIKTELFPIGIDYEKFQDANANEDVLKLKDLVVEKLKYSKIIFSVDRLDYSKGLMFRLQGFEEFLETFPEWREKVIFALNIVPSRDAIPAYYKRKRDIEEKISTINGKFSTFHWQPINYRYNHLSFNELSAFYKAADVALITPLRDGMNLVAKEFVASRTERTGVLILSELTGAANELNEALLVNPTDSSEVAKAINDALTMPLHEQIERMSMMQERLKQYDVVRWVNDFLDQLDNIKQMQEKTSVRLLTSRQIKKILHDFEIASRRCILLDYDGTLTPFTNIPSKAEPSAEVLAVLDKLCSDERNEIVIISGRDTETLDKWLGHLPAHMVAEHGAFIKRKNSDWDQQSTVLPEWKDQIRPILQLFTTRCAGSFVEEKRNTLTWHYRNTNPDLGFIRSRELLNSLQQLTVNTSLQIIDGNKVLEIRMTGIDKGITATKLINMFRPDFILCMGDDTTDEDMFRTLEQMAVTIKVGNTASSAKYNLMSQEEVLPFLKQFVTSIKTEKPHAYS